MQDTHIG